MPDLDEWTTRVWRLMDAKGFHEGRTNTRDDMLVRLCLAHTEVTEAAQEVKRHWEGEGDRELRLKVCRELGDLMYRVFDLFGCLGVAPNEILEEIHHANAGRPYKYGTPQSEVVA